MRTFNTKIPGKAGRKGCVNVSRSVSVCQSDPSTPKAPRRRQTSRLFSRKVAPYLSCLAPLLRITPPRLGRGPTELNSPYTY